ncbi:beta-propeller domain-containing protein [Caloramator australicus]|uniref:Secreted protein containing C-terminal beta-propeller domain distantly related to WD-40 repeats n=1 Tax=Caloramator australicus RC3 TaxID=857293 RepID=I7LKR7_9CLOT|nr:beta-propeller domain-containing protein [Caloramator australicus]CCJ34665.1 Secreted protein containing C-terminal beta-propeller domain distantly related to WD-40 repeats [Caloramator australicus RC3]
MKDDRKRFDLSELDKIKASKDLKTKTLNRCLDDGNKFKSFSLSKVSLVFAVIFAIVLSYVAIAVNNSKGIKVVKSYELKAAKSEKDLLNALKSVGMPARDGVFNLAQESAKSESPAHSTTNVQVEGIDEADIIKTDGKYIYSINSYKNELIIFKANDRAEIIKRLKVKDLYANIINADLNNLYLREMFIYVKEDKKYLVLLSGLIRYEQGKEEPYKKSTPSEKVDIMPIRWGDETTLISIYDIKDIDKFSLVKQFEVSGNILSSRINGDNFYLVTNKWMRYFIQDKNENVLPYYVDYDKTDKKIYIDAKNVLYNENNLSSNFTVISNINLNNFNIRMQSALGNFYQMYMSRENLYLITTQTEAVKPFEKVNGKDAVQSLENYKQKTLIYKFNLQSDVNYKGYGEVDGYIINQFSMDEYEGYFRIATTEESYNGKSFNTSNNVFVLDRNLKLTGSIRNIAEGERIYSVRFSNDKMYMVTFKQVDPLFVIDLKNPHNPKILGYLKIPGYSTYLHPLGDNRLIGIGLETADLEGRVINKGIKIALFDISELDNPKQISKLEIGGRGTFSESLYNHKALTVYKPYDLYAFDLYETRDDDSYTQIFRGLCLLRIDENEIKLLQKITQMDLLKNDNAVEYYDYGYRAVFVDKYMYVISNIGVTVLDLDEMRIIKNERI